MWNIRFTTFFLTFLNLVEYLMVVNVICKKLKHCFSEKTGLSKGYGCVEFTSKESSIKAKNQLNGFKINNDTLQVSLSQFVQ